MNEDEYVCPACGKNLSDFNSMSFEEKLLIGLDSPITQNRMFVMEVLGKIKSEKAIPKLCSMLSEKRDPYEILEIVKALLNIGTPKAFECLKNPILTRNALVRNLLEGANRHPRNHLERTS